MVHTWLAENSKYFPGLDYPPPVVYLDLWLAVESLALVIDPIAASHVTIVESLPKNPRVEDYVKPLTSCVDILCTEGQIWKILSFPVQSRV